MACFGCSSEITPLFHKFLYGQACDVQSRSFEFFPKNCQHLWQIWTCESFILPEIDRNISHLYQYCCHGAVLILYPSRSMSSVHQPRTPRTLAVWEGLRFMIEFLWDTKKRTHFLFLHELFEDQLIHRVEFCHGDFAFFHVHVSLSLYIYLLHILLFFREDTLVLTNTVCHLVTMHYIFHMSYPEFTSMDSSSFSTPLTPPQILIPYILIIFSPKSSALTSPEDESQSQWSLGVDGAPEGLDKWKAILALVTSFLLKIWWGYIRIGVGDWNSKCSLAKVWLYSFDSLG